MLFGIGTMGHTVQKSICARNDVSHGRAPQSYRLIILRRTDTMRCRFAQQDNRGV